MTSLPKKFMALAMAAWASALACRPAGAVEVTLYLMEVPPLTLNEPDRKGIAGDIVLEALRRSGYTAKIEVVPSNRAMALVQSGLVRDALIIPLARQKEREPNYTWIAPVAHVNRAFFALDRKVDSFDEARAAYRVIGVARGTAGLNILREHGFADSQIYEISDNITGARMLMLHRFDAWYGPTRQYHAWMNETDPAHKVQASPPLGATSNYLACSRICDAALAARLSAAIDKMNHDGTVKAIEARYGAD